MSVAVLLNYEDDVEFEESDEPEGVRLAALFGELLELCEEIGERSLEDYMAYEEDLAGELPGADDVWEDGEEEEEENPEGFQLEGDEEADEDDEPGMLGEWHDAAEVLETFRNLKAAAAECFEADVDLQEELEAFIGRLEECVEQGTRVQMVMDL